MIRPLKEEIRSYLRSGVAITSLTQCVEELILNSLDAGASCITVRLDIPSFRAQVADNGSGIRFEDLKLIGERYTSSKCHSLKDLEELTFYGFRGEALASIREVCGVLEIITRHRSCYKTHCKLFRDSKALEATESKFPRASTGTSVTIHDFFSGFPVRRKVISETLDFERVRHRIASIALIHPKTAFSLVNESTGTKCLQTHICKSVVSTFSQLFGSIWSKCLKEVTFEHAKFKVSGFVSTVTHHNKSLQFLFVNGRLLLKTKIHKLVNTVLGRSELLRRLPVVEVKDSSTGFEGLKNASSPQNVKTAADKHGVFVLNINCPVADYDICLDPAKTLIEFQEWEKVLCCVEKCIEQFLSKHNLISKPETLASPAEAVNTSGEVVKACDSSCTNLTTFKYRREIETSNVKKSLHSSTVFRANLVEKGETDYPEKPSHPSHGNSTSCISSANHVNDNGVIDAWASVSDNDTSSCEDFDVQDTTSVVKDNCGCLMKHSTLLVDTEARVESHTLSPEGDKPKQPSVAQRQAISIRKTNATYVSTNWTDTISTSDCVGSAEADMHKSDNSSVDLGTTFSGHFQIAHGCSSEEACAASHRTYKGHSCSQENHRSEIPSKTRIGVLSASNEPSLCVPGLVQGEVNVIKKSVAVASSPRTACKNVSVFRTSCVPSSVVALPVRTRTNGIMPDSTKTQSFSTFTSPCPITLQRIRSCTRKRPQSAEERCVRDVGLECKTRRLISLQGTCSRRLKNARYVAEKVSVPQSGACSIQGLQKINSNDVEPQCVDDLHTTQSSTLCDSRVLVSTSTQSGSMDVTPCKDVVNNTVAMSDAVLPRRENCAPVCSVQVTKECSQRNNSIGKDLLFQGQPLGNHSENSISVSSSQDKEKHMEEVVSNTDAAVLNSLRSEHRTVANGSSDPASCSQEVIDTGRCFKGSLKLLEHDTDCSQIPGSIGGLDVSTADELDKSCCHNDKWFSTFDSFHRKKLYVNRRTGHTSFEPPSEFDVEGNDRESADGTGATEEGKGCQLHLPHPCGPHLSFSCTPWLPRQERRQREGGGGDKDMLHGCEDNSKAQLVGWYKEHLQEKQTDEKLCKWSGAEAMLSYEHNLLQSDNTRVAHLLDSWQNPVFAAPEKNVMMVTKQTGDKNQVLVHNVIHPYRFSRDMLANMRLVNQLDEKFIVGVVSDNVSGAEEGENGLLVLVDQHAAHERVRLELLQADLYEDDSNRGECKPRIKSSPVSPPLEFSLSFEEIRLLRRYRSEVERIGIRFMIGQSSEFSGETSIVVHGLPSVFVAREVSEVMRGRASVAGSIVKELIKEHLEHVTSTCGVAAAIPKVISRVISSQACHGAVKFGEPLGRNECQELIECLSKCQLPFQCAHGRPSVIPLVDLKFLGRKTPSVQTVLRPKMNKLRSRAKQATKNSAAD